MNVRPTLSSVLVLTRSGGSRSADFVSVYKSSGFSPVFQNFLCGGLAATTLWCIAYPFDVVKNRMMAQPDVKPRKYEVGIVSVLPFSCHSQTRLLLSL